VSVATSALAGARLQAQRFFVKGATIALVSGVLWGLYSAFVVGAQGTGPWVGWFSEQSPLSSFAQIYVLGLLAAGINDTLAALWALGSVSAKGKLRDLWRSFRSKPGAVMVVCGVIGGPLSSGAYLVALKLAGPAAAPITALCPVVGAVIGRLVFKQVINARMAAGIAICLTASLMIGSTSLGGEAAPTMALGLVVALFAAVGWGIEGAVAGYGTVLIDAQIGITIRLLTSGILNLAIITPLLCVIGGDGALFGTLLSGAVSSGASLGLFAVSALFCCASYWLWYRGNSMCGTALGMAGNGSYSFWTPLFCWLILGLGFGWADQEVAPIVWVAAPLLFLGLVLVALNPLELLRWRDGIYADVRDLGRAAEPSSALVGAGAGAGASAGAGAGAGGAGGAGNSAGAARGGRSLPVNYAVLLHVAQAGEADPDSVIAALDSGRPSGSGRGLRRDAVADALAAAEKSGVLEVAGVAWSPAGQVALRYRTTQTGQSMIERFIASS
jgi:drug/metabolite transporter (DMT)-like permease